MNRQSKWISEKTFISLLIPLSMMYFFSIPLLTLNALPYVTQVPRIRWEVLQSWLPNLSTPHVTSSKEVPLFFYHIPYSENGNKIHLHEKRYLNMAESLQKSGIRYFGYIHIFEADKADRLPKVLFYFVLCCYIHIYK